MVLLMVLSYSIELMFVLGIAVLQWDCDAASMFER